MPEAEQTWLGKGFRLTKSNEDDQRDDENNQGPLRDDVSPPLEEVFETELDFCLKLQTHPTVVLLIIPLISTTSFNKTDCG